MAAATNTPVARVEQLAQLYEASAKIAADVNGENSIYDRVYASGLRQALAMLADEPDAPCCACGDKRAGCCPCDNYGAW